MITTGDSTPALHTSHSVVATTAISDWVTSSSRRRGKRSASDPASGPTSTAGRNWAKVANPTHAALPVRWYSTNGTVTFWIQLPVFDTSAADQKMAKSR